MTETDTPVRFQVAHEVRQALARATEPMTAQQLLPECPSALSAETLSKTMHSLKRSGAVIECDPVSTKLGPRKTYRLRTESERLMDHLEADLAENSALTVPEIGVIDGITVVHYPHDLDCAAASHNGDEHCQCRHATVTDPIISAIDRISEPRWLGGTLDAQRLRALARCALIAPHTDLAAWLTELAGIIESMTHDHA